MILYEYEGKQLLFQAGLDVPHSQLLTSLEDEMVIKPPLVLKAQTLSGKRADAGGIVMVEELDQLNKEIKDLFAEVINKEQVEKILVEEKIEYQKAYYLSISYDTQSRGPILTISSEGGTGIEGREVEIYSIDPISKNVTARSETTKQSQSPESEIASPDLHRGRNDGLKIPPDLIKKLIDLFFDQDLLLLEINPLVQGLDGRWIALDAKIKLDDDAKARHEEWHFPPRGVPGYVPSPREVEAKKIDQADYRGVAGSTYFDLPGNIAILSSGGGVSLTAMDALIKAGGKPANFTEYSGNPPKEKVVKLTKIVLSKPALCGLWVIGTVAANFTDIYETLSGLMEGLREAQQELDKKFIFPIVIRRGGPREKEAYQMLKQVQDFKLHLFGEETSISQCAKIMVDLASKFHHQQNFQDE